MAIMRHGPLGTFTGPIGNIVGSVWKGKQVIRQKRTTGLTAFTELQTRQQIKFSLIMKLLQPLTGFIKQSFSQDPPNMTRFNKAFSLNYRNAIAGDYPDFKIEFSKLILGRGKLDRVAKISCSSPAAGQVQLEWMVFNPYQKERMNDKAWLLCYCERLNHWSILMSIAERGSCSCSFYDSSLSGESLHVYLGFISANGKLSSESDYAGVVVVE